MNLSKEMALILHRMMWRDMRKELGDNPSPDARNNFKTDWIQRMFPGEYISNHCFLCEYARGGCSYCPIDWGNEQVSKWQAKCAGENTSYLSSPISEILALPERDTEPAFKSNEKAVSDVAEGPSPDVMIMKELGQASGLPSWAPVNEHIEAIKSRGYVAGQENLLGKGKEAEMKARAATIASYNADYYYALLKHRQTLSYNSGLPVWVPDEKHIEAIKKKASDSRAKEVREGLKKWLSVFSELPASEELQEHVSAIIDNNYNRGKKDLLEEMRKRVED